MFERTRSNLTSRLRALLDRFDAICARAEEHREHGRHAVRLGLPDDGKLVPVLDEIAAKASEQGGLCARSISHLLVDRSFPPMFKRGVTQAEIFAGQCEGILDQLDAGRVSGKEAFRHKFGDATDRA